MFKSFYGTITGLKWKKKKQMSTTADIHKVLDNNLVTNVCTCACDMHVENLTGNKLMCKINPQTAEHTMIDYTPFLKSNKTLGFGNQGNVFSGLYFENGDMDDASEFSTNKVENYTTITKDFVVPITVAIKQVKLIRENGKEKKNASPGIHIYNEAKILSNLDHPGIIKFIGFFCDYSYYYLIVEHINGPDLFKFVIDGEFSYLNRIEQHNLTLQFANAISYLHSKNYIHLDIKLENVMVKVIDNGPNKRFTYQIVLIDFAFARPVVDGVLISVYSGSLLYADPDIIKKIPYNPKAADIWSFGTTVYSMFSRCSLFDCPGKTEEDLEPLFVHKIMSNTPVVLYRIPEQYRNILAKIFTYDSSERLKIDDIVTKLNKIKF